MQSLHLACAMARSAHSNIVLLQLMRVPSLFWLGTPLGEVALTREEVDALRDFMSVAEDYGVEAAVQPMQYESLVDALVQAAGEFGASVVFARLPEHAFAFQRRLQMWSLRRQLQRQHCRLYLVGEDEKEDWRVPSISVKAAK